MICLTIIKTISRLYEQFSPTFQSLHHKPIDTFCESHSYIVDHRYLIYTKDVRKNEELLLFSI